MGLSASADLRADREIVLAAVRSHGLALHHATGDLQADREVVRAAVKSHGLALHHAATELCNDRTIVLTAVRSHSLALLYASPALQQDPEILEAVTRGGVGSLANECGATLATQGCGGSARQHCPPLPRVSPRVVRFSTPSDDPSRRNRPRSLPART